LVILTI